MQRREEKKPGEKTDREVMVLLQERIENPRALHFVFEIL